MNDTRGIDWARPCLARPVGASVRVGRYPGAPPDRHFLVPHLPWKHVLPGPHQNLWRAVREVPVVPAPWAVTARPVGPEDDADLFVLFRSLSEVDRRPYVAVEADPIGQW